MSTTAMGVDQRLAALEKANWVRRRCCELKRDIRAGLVSVPDVLLDLPVWARSMEVYDLLVAQRSWGRVKALGMLRRVQVSAPRPLGGLTERERGELARLVRRELERSGRRR